MHCWPARSGARRYSTSDHDHCRTSRPAVQTARLRLSVVSQPRGSVLEVALFGEAGGATCRGPVGGAGRCVVTGHLQEMRADGVEAVMLGDSVVVVKRPQQVESGLRSPAPWRARPRG